MTFRQPFAWFLLTATLLAGCTRQPATDANGPVSMTWTDISGEYRLSEGMEIFEGADEAAPLKAWMARVDVLRDDVSVEVVASADSDGRESVSDMVQDRGACLGVNGGYFLQNDDVFEHIGLLIANGEFVHSATHGIFVDDVRHELRRAAIGFDDRDVPIVGWVSSRQDSAFWWSIPFDPSEQLAASDTTSIPDSLATSFPIGVYQSVQDAVAAGPAILKDGKHFIPVEEEIFFPTGEPDARTAAGYDSEGRLLLLVVDGRQGDSRGVSLEELADLMLEFGATDALNLDGGGSSTFVVRDELLNQPAGGTYQREVVSGIVVHCP